MAPKPGHARSHGHAAAHPTRTHAAAHPPAAAPAAPVPAPPKPARKLELPSLVAGVDEVGRLIHELDQLNDALLQLGIRAAGTNVQIPKTSRMMDRVVEANNLNLLQPTDRKQLMQYLTELRTKAPVMHFSFSADPSPTFVDKLTVWLRREINPDVLLSIGLQPNIGAGCILRTTNKYFDLSLRQDFINKRAVLLESLKTMAATPAEAAVAPPAEVVS